jgi:hypothetical protein
MKKLFAIVDGAGQRLFSLIAPSPVGEISVIGIEGTRVDVSDYDAATFAASSPVKHSGLILTLNFGDEWSATEDELDSNSTLEVSEPLPDIRLVFERANRDDGTVSLSAARARKT